jgi:molecular chaperone IbpA
MFITMYKAQGFHHTTSKKGVNITIQLNSLRSDKKAEPEDEHTYHRGISYRKFDRKFTLADDIVVTGANLENGLLCIDLERVVPEEKKPRLIEVK